MKKKHYGITLLAAAFIAMAPAASAQDCNNLFLLKPGAQVELSRYDGSGQPRGGKMVNVVEKTEEKDGEQITTVTSTNYTDAGVANSTTTLVYICDGKSMRIFTDNAPVMDKLAKDLEAMAKQVAEQEVKGKEKGKFKGFVFASVAEPIEYPLQITEGMQLKGHELTTLSSTTVTEKELREVGLPKRETQYNSAGMATSVKETRNYMKVLVDREIATATVIGVRNIKVGPKEAVSVPTGEYQCYKITKELYSQAAGKKDFSNLYGDVNIEGKAPSQLVTEWYAPGIGIVKTEIKDAKGKVLITLQATKISS